VKEAKVSGDGLTSQPEGGEASASGNVDKIRDILFGTQMRDYEKRFARLEERLLKESLDLRAEVKRRFDALEGYIKKEVESLADRLKAEQSERAESAKEVSQELKNLTKNFDRKTTQLDEQLTKGQRDLRQQLLDQSKNLSAEIQQKYDELAGLLEREAAELNETKTDRSALAALFTEVALRLNNEFKIPGGE
jgi:uncharacterized phage infection (PIP) family protein YhgE